MDSYEHYWIVCLFGILIFYKNTLKEEYLNQVNIIFITNCFFIFVIFLIFISLALKDNIISYNLMYHSNVFVGEFAGEYFPRSSGISRMALISFFFVNSLYFSKLFEKKSNFIFLFLISFLILIILLLQSRAVILFFFVSYVAIHIVFKFYNFKERLKYILITIIIPVLLFISYPLSKTYLIQKFDIKVEDMKEDLDKTNFMRNDFFAGTAWNKKNLKKENITVEKNLTTFSNNRIAAWNYLLQVFFRGEIDDKLKDEILRQRYIPNIDIKKKIFNYFVGFGPQADRYFFKSLKKNSFNTAKTVLGPFGAHASNIYVYSLICGGLISFIIIIIINLLVLYKILRVIINRDKLNIPKNFLLMSSIFIILFLMYRGLLENSYGVCGVDLIIFISADTVISKNLKEIND